MGFWTANHLADPVMRHFFEALHGLRVPLFVAAFSAFVLAGPPQSIETYRAIAQGLHFYIKNLDGDSGRNTVWLAQAVLGFLALLLLVSSLWFDARRSLAQRSVVTVQATTAGAVKWLPTLIAAVPVLAVALGIMRAYRPPLDKEALNVIRPFVAEVVGSGKVTPAITSSLDRTALDYFSDYNWLLLGAAISLLVLTAAAAIGLARIRRPRIHYTANRRWTGIARLVTLVCCTAAVLFMPARWLQVIGALAIFLVFAALLTRCLQWLAELSDEKGLPVIWLLIGLAGVLSLLNINDNHEARSLALPTGEAVPAGAPPTLDGQFREWWAAREGKDRFKASDYPVYVVAAQGGGIYAAAHVANALASLRDHCPAFAHHLFAVSGVSGGSVGSAIYANVAHANEHTILACSFKGREKLWQLSVVNPAEYLRPTEEALGTDLLAPLAAGGLFPDFMQKLLFPALPRFDRIRRFEEALETSAARAVTLGATRPGVARRSLMERPYLEHWRPGGNVPALLMNATRVGTGRRFVFSPFAIPGIDEADIAPLWQQGKSRFQPPLSTVAGISARFPWLMPAAWYWNETPAGPGGTMKRRKVRLVDGGYFDNSGVATALDVIRGIEALNLPVRLHLIILTKGAPPDQQFTGLDEPLTPIFTLLNARAARGHLSIKEARSHERATNGKMRVSVIQLKDFWHILPLGWHLSPASQTLIRFQNGNASNCAGDDRASRKSADCVVAQIHSELAVYGEQ